MLDVSPSWIFKIDWKSERIISIENNHQNSILQVNHFLKQLEREKQKQQQQITQDRLNNEFEKMNESFSILRNQIDNERNNIRNESVRDSNEMKVLIGQNHK